MRQKIIGIYTAGWENIEVVLMEGESGEFYFIPELGRNKVARIKIGADHARWEKVFDVLLHEIDEYVMSSMGFRFKPTQNINNSHDDYAFIMTHTQFTEKSARVAEFISDASLDVYKAWKVWKKKT